MPKKEMGILTKFREAGFRQLVKEVRVLAVRVPGKVKGVSIVEP